MAVIVAPTHHDVGVRMGGVVMIHRDPIELGAEILLHLRHQPAGQWLQILVLVAVLRRDDEAELVPVAIVSLAVV